MRLTGLPGAASFEGKVASRWAPQRQEDFSTPRSGSFEQVLAVVAVWESWTGGRTLASSGRVQPAWLASQACKDWKRLLEDAHQETMDVRRRSPRASGVEAEADAAVARYHERLVQAYGRLNLDVLGSDELAGEQPAIRLRQVFEVPLAAWDPPRPELPARMWRELVECGEVAEDDLPPGLRPEQVDKWRRTRTERPPQPVLEAVASSEGQRLVVLGDPGAGKSTLARYLALALAGGLDTVPAELDDMAGAVPVVVELRHLAAERWQGRTVEDFWEEFNATERMCLPRNVLEHLFTHTQRPVIVIFDGLDEIFDPVRRTEVARQVAAFAQTHDRIRVMVTSRVVGFAPGVFTTAGFSRVKLEDLTQEQVESFISRWYDAAHPADPEESSHLARRLIGAVRGFTSVAELAGNPLLLTILASIGLGATIPRDRREVYRRAVDVLTGRWDRDAKNLHLPRQSHPEVAAAIDELDTGLLQELLERLARRLQEGAADTQTGTLISRTDLTAVISSYVSEMNYPQHVARIVANAMVDRLHERAFLLHPYGAGMYGFVHRTFLEYLAARDLSQRYTAREWTPDQLIDMLAQRAINPTWHEVILLLLGQISRHAEAEHAAFIARLLEMHRRRTSPAFRRGHEYSGFLKLAIRALAEAHRIGRPPSTPPEHPHRSLAVQSSAVIDALTSFMNRYPWVSVEDALPAMASFPWSWSGRERFFRWYVTQLVRPDLWGRGGDVAASLCRNVHEAGRLAYVSWAAATADVLEVMVERWPGDDSHTAILSAACNANAHEIIRTAALDILAERWPDEDSRTIILSVARDTSADESVRSEAVEVLAEFWPDDEDSRATALGAAGATSPDYLRSAALRVLGERWPDGEGSRTAVLSAAQDASADATVRSAALQVLGERWPDGEGSRTAVLSAAQDASADATVRTVALEALGRWPDDDSRTVVLSVFRDASADATVRSVALRVLGGRWPDDDSRTVVLSVFRDASADATVRSVALLVLGEHWPDNDSRTVVLSAARDTSADATVRTVALQVLGGRWPDDDSRTVVLSAARDTSADATVRSVALLVLGEHWPDDEDSSTVALSAVRDTNAHQSVRYNALQVLRERWPAVEDIRTTFLSVAGESDAHQHVRYAAVAMLGEWWPHDEDSRTTVLSAAGETGAHEDVRCTALEVLRERWPDDESHTAILNAARDTNAIEDVRSIALMALVERWPDLESTRQCLLECVESAEEDGLRVTAIRSFALMGPQDSETVELLTRASRADVSEIVRVSAAQAISYIEAIRDLGPT
ncbi:NACHT domain-containing protein [Streptomyces sp. NBC_00145]|uniref:NACHT domain-containing protein n=1 Tax=Streptomyces sp. NBC_00145 TaxID=2975666 RepID=UPI002E18F693